EDGIRDKLVTGVQTCALPILSTAGTGVIALAVLLTMSRGAVLAGITIVSVFLLRLRMNWRLLLPVVALGAGLLFMPRLFFERVQIGRASCRERVEWWSVADGL